MVFTASGLANVTVPGPDCLLQTTVGPGPVGAAGAVPRG